ncbi:MAG: UPF0182 family protein, partial [Caldanaerobacter sp.]
MGGTTRLSKVLPIVGLLVFVVLIYWGASFYTDWLWFKSLNYESVFLTILITKWAVGLVAGLIVFLIFFINLLFTRSTLIKGAGPRPISNGDIVTLYQPPWSKYVQSTKLLTISMAIFSFLPAILIALSVTKGWNIVQQFLHSTSFNMNDPIFHRDIGFYVFKLPFYHFIYRLLLWTIVLSFLAISGIYVLTGGVQNGWKSILRFEVAKYHLSGLAAVIFLLRAWGYRLDQYMLLYSERGIIYGPGYTDIHANLLAYKILFVLTLGCAAVILINLLLSRFRLVFYAIGFLIAGIIVFGNIYPAAVQKFIVVPNEMNREKPYIENAIRFTRLAYKLDNIEKRFFPAGRELTAEDLKNN